MSQFSDVMNNVSSMLDQTGKFIGQQKIYPGSPENLPTNAQAVSQATNGQGIGNDALQGKMTGSDMLNAILSVAAPEDGEMDAATQEFTHNLGALTGDVTRQFQPQEIQSAIQSLKGQPLTGQYYQDNAIKLANYLHAKGTGAVVNSPVGGQQ